MRRLNEQAPVRIDVPSPLAGEGFAAGRSGLAWVRGSVATIAFQKQSLTRPRFAQAPSPARGEGKYLTPLPASGRG
jgi:hypothetical protein